jgi:hypothetical protein
MEVETVVGVVLIVATVMVLAWFALNRRHPEDESTHLRGDDHGWQAPGADERDRPGGPGQERMIADPSPEDRSVTDPPPRSAPLPHDSTQGDGTRANTTEGR